MYDKWIKSLIHLSYIFVLKIILFYYFIVLSCKELFGIINATITNKYF